jgi:mRNA-degrading endonuclease RelE of RelBE toxin-antitoxin system
MGRAKRQFRRLARRAQLRVGTAIEKLAAEHKPPGAFPIDPELNIFRVLVAAHRIIYRVDDLHKEIAVIMIQEWPVLPRE